MSDSENPGPGGGPNKSGVSAPQPREEVTEEKPTSTLSDSESPNPGGGSVKSGV